MTLKDKMKTYNFWISLVSAVLLLVRIIGDNYGFEVDAGLVMDITTGICGIFVILGIISVPQKTSTTENSKIMGDDNVMMIGSNKVGQYNEIFTQMNEKLQNNIETIKNVEEKAENINFVCENDSDFLNNEPNIIEEKVNDIYNEDTSKFTENDINDDVNIEENLINSISTDEIVIDNVNDVVNEVEDVSDDKLKDLSTIVESLSAEDKEKLKSML